MTASRFKILIFSLLIFCDSTFVFSQKSIPFLEKKVTINANTENVEAVLKMISQPLNMMQTVHSFGYRGTTERIMITMRLSASWLTLRGMYMREAGHQVQTDRSIL